MVTRCPDGTLLFELYRPSASCVTIAGTFNKWSPDALPMKRGRSDGWWTCSVKNLVPGDHSFQYVIDHDQWEADFAASGVELNGFGTWVSRLVVRHGMPQSAADRAGAAPADKKLHQSSQSAHLERELEAIADLIRDAGARLRDGSLRDDERRCARSRGRVASIITFGTHIPAEEAVEIRPSSPTYTKAAA